MNNPLHRPLVSVAKLCLKAFPAAHAPAVPESKRSAPKAERVVARGNARARAEYEDEGEYDFLQFFSSRDEAAGDVVLDLGCGYGGRLNRLAGLARRLAIGFDIKPEMVSAGARLAAELGNTHTAFLVSVGEAMPLADASVDVVISYDVLEHVHKPDEVLAEVFRVLVPGGRFFAVFPPYYHPTGSHLEGFVSHLPYANLLFPSRILVDAVDEILEERGDRFRPGPLRPGDKLYWLNGLTIRRFRRLVAEIGFTVREWRLPPLISKHNRSFTGPVARAAGALLAPLAHIPVVQEAFTHRVVAVLVKPDSGR